MCQRLAIFCYIALCAGTLLAQQPAGTHTILVLDSTRHMGKSLAAAPTAGQPSLTRLAVARDAAGALFRSLARQEEHTVSLVVFGHRVAAPAEGDATSVTQTEYLRLTHGTLEELRPEEDVEIVRESRPLTEDDLPAYETTLDALKPWGEASISLAIERAVELSTTADAKTQVIVLTGGGASAPGAVESDGDRLLDLVRDRNAEVSIVHLGATDQGSGSQHGQLREIALASGGLYYAPTSPQQVTEALRRIIAPPPEPARIETAVSLQPAGQPPPPPPADDIVVPAYDVVFEITYYGMPVKDAEVIIRGPNFDLVYDRELEYKVAELRASRLAGTYIFRAVPEDAVGYTVEITANVKNRTYKVVRGFSVDYDNKAPGRSFKIQLEKSKEPPPVPAAAAP